MQALLLLFVILGQAALVDHVDPFIGTGGLGYGAASVPPGAQLPFSSVRLSPDTAPSALPWAPFEHFGGYHYPDDEIRVFSHLHTQGAGMLDLGLLAVMPVSRSPSPSLVSEHGFRSRFSHARESASPGFYSVFLEGPSVLAELATGVHMTANHRYSWTRPSDRRVILFPLAHAMPQNEHVNASISIDASPQSVRGFTFHMGGFGERGGGVQPHISVTFNETFSSFGTWSNTTVSAGNAQASGHQVGGWVEFGPGVSSVELMVGVSWISQAQADLNAQLCPPLFDLAKEAGAAAWEMALGKIVVQENGNADDLVKFYTALYHAQCAPTTLSESDGVYLGFDRQVHTLVPPMRAYYTDMSMWDVYRCTFPLLSLLYQSSVMGDVAQSIVLMAQQGGSLPQWPFVDIYTCAMIGQHAQNILADAALWNVTNFDHHAAYQVMVTAATTDEQHCVRSHRKTYESLGYVPMEDDRVSTCLTLAYAHNDYAIAQMANLLGFTSDYQMFLNRSDNYLNVWDPSQQFFCPRKASGAFVCPNELERLNVFSNNFIEGDAWHYRFYGTDPLRTFNSSSDLVRELDIFMTRGRIDPLTVLPNPYYWAGNEPDIGAPWAFAYANRSDLTAHHVQWVVRNRYSTRPDGIPGNDDYGALSGWLVWAYMGLYPLFSGKAQLSVGIPIFPSMVISLESNRTLTISTHGQGVRIAKLVVDGATVAGSILNLDTFLHATAIDFYLH